MPFLLHGRKSLIVFLVVAPMLAATVVLLITAIFMPHVPAIACRDRRNLIARILLAAYRRAYCRADGTPNYSAIPAAHIIADCRSRRSAGSTAHDRTVIMAVGRTPSQEHQGK